MQQMYILEAEEEGRQDSWILSRSQERERLSSLAVPLSVPGLRNLPGQGTN